MYLFPFAERLLWFSSALSSFPGQVPTQEVNCAAEGNVLACTHTSNTPSRATTLPAGTGGATQIGPKRTFQIKLGNGLTSSRVATTFTVPRRLHPTPPTRPHFHGNGCAAGPSETRKIVITKWQGLGKRGSR